MSKYLRVGPGVLDCLPRSYYSDIKYHLTVRSRSSLRRPHLTILNPYNHLKPQPCYTKPHSDSQHSASSLSSFNTNFNLYIDLCCIRVKAQ
ncbi:hypothetical protein P692DRAFT_201794245 [Suillus brevipes Sb2]|nr:hypothetical protein P692DRAFT_201794245 [Suillus brevipes Sb2]